MELLGEYRSLEPWAGWCLSGRRRELQVLDGEAARRLDAFLVSRDEFAIRGEDQDQYVAVLRTSPGSRGDCITAAILYRR